MAWPSLPPDDEERGIPGEVGSNEFLEAHAEEPISFRPEPRPCIESPYAVVGIVGLELFAMVILGGSALVWVIAPFIDDQGDGLYYAIYKDNTTGWIITAGIHVALIGSAYMHRRTLYRELTAFNIDNPSKSGASSKPRACMICYKHPVSKRYHLKEVHGMKKIIDKF